MSTLCNPITFSANNLTTFPTTKNQHSHPQVKRPQQNSIYNKQKTHFMKLLFLALLITFCLARRQGSRDSCRQLSNWDGNRCTCPQNMINLNGKCVCDYGYWKNGDTCEKCDDQFLWKGRRCQGSQFFCQEGYRWNGKGCVQNWNQNYCGDNQYWNGKFCQEYVYPIFCLPGFRWNQKACILRPTLPQDCDSSSYWNGKECVAFVFPIICNSGFIWDSLSSCCIASFQSATPRCPPLNYWNGNACVLLTSALQCSAAQYWNGDMCVPIRKLIDDILCKSGWYFDGLNCKPTFGFIQCQKDFRWDVVTASCAFCGCRDGQDFDIERKICVDRNLNVQQPVILVQNGAIRIDGGAVLNAAGQSLATSPIVSFDNAFAFIQGTSVPGVPATQLLWNGNQVSIRTPGNNIQIPVSTKILNAGNLDSVNVTPNLNNILDNLHSLGAQFGKPACQVDCIKV